MDTLSPGPVVVLSLEWEPHSGLGALTLTRDKRVPASEIRALFAKHRRGPASVLLPSDPSSPVPEMRCFDPHECVCLRYEMGHDNKARGEEIRSTVFSPQYYRSYYGRQCYESSHMLWRSQGARSHQLVRAGVHWQTLSNNGPPCLTSHYVRQILVCPWADGSRMNPPHEWLHAMDPDTYDQAVPLCRDEGCMNYTRGKGVSVTGT